MCPRTGRPKSDNPKEFDVKVRFDKELHTRLLDYCERKKITRTEAIRTSVKKLLDQEQK